MNPSELFIRRPITTTLVMLAFVLFGLIGFRMLPVSDLPNIDYPTITVNASLPGADPATMAATVATPLERQFSNIEGLDSMSSTSTQGSTSITLQFSLSRSIDAAALDVQTAISAAGRQLPPSMPNPPTFHKVNPAAAPIFYMALSSPTLPISTVDEYAETRLAQRISMINGVSQVSVYGSQQYAVRVQMDPSALASRGIAIDDVATALQHGNTNQPTGILYGQYQALPVQTNGQLTNAAAYKNLIIAYRNGAPVRLDQLGNVVDSVANDKIAAWYNGTRGVVLAIERQPGTNTIQIVDQIKAVIPQLQKDIPPSVNLNVLYDRSQSIRASVNDVEFTLMLTMALVVMVIFLFLRNFTATMIPSLALPTSIIGTFGAMYVLGFSLDNLSLMALTLSTGFVVDDAIVMLENIVRHEEVGEPRFEAALKGSGEIAFTIMAMTISLVAVFIPILFMSGIVGRLFNEFAVTITVAILVSGIVSITLTPMLASRFLKASAEHHRGWFYHSLERTFDLALAGYEWGLKRVLAHKRASIAVFFALFAVTAYLFVVVPKGFLPSEDLGQLFVSTQGAQGIGFEDMARHQQTAARIVAQDPNVRNFMSSVGAGGRNATGNTGMMFLSLKPRNERRLTADQVAQELRVKLARVPGMQFFIMNPPAIRIGGIASRALYQISLQGLDLEELNKATLDLTNAMAKMPELTDVNSDQEAQSPQLNVNINRDQASMLGVTAEEIERTLADAYGQQQVSQIYTSTNEYQVILEVAPQYQLDPNALSTLYVRSSSGTLVPLDAVVTLKQGVGPLQVNHIGQLPSDTISFNLKPGVSLSQVTGRIDDLAHGILPSGVTYSYQGASQVFQSSFANLGGLLLLSVLVIYIVLGILYESFIHPLTVLSGLPSAGLGALLTLMLFHKELDLYGFVGLIMLIGIVKKNAIMMIDFALETEQKERRGAEDAIYRASLVRFRPIMMTSVAALMGTLPIAFGLGAGGEARQSLGLAVVGGLLVSQVLTLFITPVVYVYMDRFQGWIERQLPSHRHGERGRHPQPEDRNEKVVPAAESYM